METLLCETENINKNPKYRIIKYKDEYLMIDLVSTWLALFFPMINWLIPKKYVKISEKDFDDLNIVKPVKNKAFWPVAGSTILFGVTFRKYIPSLNIQLEKNMVIVICCVIFLGLLILFLFLNRKLRLEIYNNNSSKGKNNFISFIKKLLLHNILLFFIWRSFNNGSKYVINFKSSKYNRLYWLVGNDCRFLSVKHVIDY